MDKEAFFEIVDKYNKGLATTEEEQVIFIFCEQMQQVSSPMGWTLTEEERIKLNLLGRINESIRKEKYKPPCIKNTRVLISD